jgi:hypothetical protein
MSFYDQEPNASVLLGLIERNAPRLMRAGGGALTQDCQNMVHPLTQESRATIISAAAWAPSIPSIERLVGYSGATVRKVLREAGLPTPYLRDTGIEKGPGAKRRAARTRKILALKHSIKSP